jgi:predicted signal transduction protein with EAL and GGDEF domain
MIIYTIETILFRLFGPRKKMLNAIARWHDYDQLIEPTNTIDIDERRKLIDQQYRTLLNSCRSIAIDIRKSATKSIDIIKYESTSNNAVANVRSELIRIIDYCDQLSQFT